MESSPTEVKQPLLPLLFSIQEAANMMRIGPHTVRAYVRSGLIKATRIGARVLISTAEVARIAAEGLRRG